MVYIDCIQTTKYSHSVRSDEFQRLKDLMCANFERDGEANGDQDGKLNLNYYLAKGMAGFYRDEDLLATVLTRLYDEDYKRDDILDLLSVLGPKLCAWKHDLIRKGLADSRNYIIMTALRCIDMWEAQNQYDEIIREMLKTATDKWVIQELQYTLDQDY